MFSSGRALLAAAFASLPLFTAAQQLPPQPAVEISPTPAFTIGRLVALPADNWVTNGGNVFNQRYSPLKQLNRDNVAQLKAKWRTSMGSGALPGNAGQAQILEYDGILYVVNGANDVFAIAVETGNILWTYHGNPDPKAGNPFGRSSRGVALGDGKVFVGQLDAKLVALDQKTGEVIWSVEVAPWREGFAITSAPLYYDGLVITGFNGGEMGTRGRVIAVNAADGSAAWTFYTVPGPGEFGHDTWPQDSDAWKQGGAPVWQTPAVDPELDMIYFSTGNPGPDLHGGLRPGDNLFSVSIVALNAHTGKYQWHFQQIHHDIWDYDSPNPVVLFDAPVNGVMRKGLVEVGKTGWAYILDRETGEPLIGIQERPVPQEARQATSATQPYPTGDAIVPQEITITPEGARLEPGTHHVPNHGRIFTPFWTDEVTVKPGTMGGANWPPSSYDPNTHLLYVCASDRISTFVVDPKLVAPTQPNTVYMGGRFGQAQAPDGGIFAALDVTTNRLVWRQQWRDICYSGSIVTGGGLLFVGRTDGRLTALDKDNGNKLWEFMTDAGVNSTVTTFMHKGQQYVAVHAGGGVFANGKRGDGIWLFSLDGAIEPYVPSTLGAAPTPRGAPGARPDLARGEEIYKQICMACHGETGAGGHGGGPTIVAGQSPELIMAVTASGRNTMPSFAATYSSADIRNVTAYIVDVLGGK
ncbi:MAG: PQQ-binding-like beta-propeller repeat protein [Gammaproteobacteria bacterium]|nr:PQQ-binding-like beta-propeller repeat protein [Gammaproteobacteria bacterium]